MTCPVFLSTWITLSGRLLHLAQRDVACARCHSANDTSKVYKETFGLAFHWVSSIGPILITTIIMSPLSKNEMAKVSVL